MLTEQPPATSGRRAEPGLPRRKSTTMKIAYLFHWLDVPESGVYKKVTTQAQYWTAQGCETQLFLLTAATSALARRTSGEHGLPLTVKTYTSTIDQAVQLFALQRSIVRWQPDLVYCRYLAYQPALDLLARRVPTVVELNSDDLLEFKIGPAWRYHYNRLTRAAFYRRVSGMVSVSYELVQKPHFAKFAKPTVVIGNSIELAKYDPLPPHRNAHPRLVFLGSKGQSWHGLDKLVELADLFPQWQFDIVGLTAEEVEIHAKQPNITYHGFLPHAAYAAVIAQADVAIGALATYRKGLNETSTLKVREYLAFGLPVILDHSDPDFLAPQDFLLQLPNVADNIKPNVGVIERFVLKWCGRRVPRTAVAHLDVAVKETARLSFFYQLAKGAR